MRRAISAWPRVPAPQSPMTANVCTSAGGVVRGNDGTVGAFVAEGVFVADVLPVHEESAATASRKHSARALTAPSCQKDRSALRDVLDELGQPHRQIVRCA